MTKAPSDVSDVSSHDLQNGLDEDAAGEQFLLDVWTAASTGPRWAETLLIITYDEHGGCYDHVPPPGGAKTMAPFLKQLDMMNKTQLSALWKAAAAKPPT